MNSYSIQRQNPITDDQLHSFLRDKQRWENAIVMYQGRDPLDHWYNYLLWYTAHGHGDPENKYRETLERCLTLFEHNEFYKHDERMVRLWLKYIDMQPNPLHFYQVLYQREVGRQVADFYISWAGYYESINALKDAEAVYDLSFQQKAQPYAALHHAHSKLMFARQQQQPQASAQPHQQALHQQQHQQQPQQQHHHHHPVPQQHEATPPHQPPHQQQQQHAKHISTSQQQVSYHAHAAVAYTAHEQHEDVYHQHHPHQHPHQQQHHHHQQQHPQQQQQQQQLEPHQQQQHLHIQQQQQHLYHQPNAYESPQQHQQQQHAAVHSVDPNAPAAYSHGQHPAAAIPIEQHLPPANAAGRQQITNNHQQHFAEPPHHVQQHHADTQQLPPNVQLNHQPHQAQPEPNAKHHHQPIHQVTARLEPPAATPPDDGGVGGIRLPRKFVAFSHNSSEVWRPPLYLEEPDDPSRQCHYAKTRVYPEGLTGNEYSPEELRAVSYRQRAKQNVVYQQQRQLEQQTQPYAEPVNEAGPPPSAPYFNGQYEAYANGVAHNVEAPKSGAEEEEAEESQPEGEEEAEEQEEEAENETEDGAEDDDEEQPEDGDAEEDDDEDEEEGDEDDADHEATLYRQQKQQQHQQSYHRQYNQDAHGNAYGSAHHQHIDSTVRFSMQTVQHDNQSKTIKIKFKKERHIDSDATNGGGATGGGGYTIENFYQQETPFSPIAKEANSAKRSEVHHSFHPYLLGQTSTPKSSGIGGKRHKSKLKRPSHHHYSSQKPQHNHHQQQHNQNHHHNNNNNNNNFQAAAYSNSNSSTAEYYGGGGGDEVLKSNGGGGASAASGLMTTAKSKKSSNGFREYNDNANYSFISAATLDNSNCSISSAVGRLNFRDITSGAGGQHGLNNTTLGGAGGNSVADFSTYQENSYFATQHDYEAKERRLNKALETIERHMAKEAIDPFNSELCKAFLTKLDFPAAEDDDATANYKITQTPLPKIANTKALTLPDGVHFNIDKEVGRGSYGSVYKATDVTTGSIVALKYQKPPNIWEIYICYQVLKRIKNPNILPGYMDISTAIIAPNASLIATEFSPFGSLLDINNKIRQATTKVMHESLVMHFSSQICQIIHHLHRQHIIHADIKPDNFLLMRVPSTDLPYPSLRLIDFGCAIDMTLFPDRDDTKFRKVIQTDGFTCIEMQEGRPWSYETDLFCIAGTVHVMLLGEYMQLQKRCGAWDIKQKLPRYLKKHVWTKFFNEMLNINGGSLPDLGEMREVFDEETAKMDSELQKQIRSLSNILYKR